MSENKYFNDLGQPFPYSDVNWRFQHVDIAQSEGYAIPYLDARAIADRFDNVIGQNNWQDDYVPWHTYVEKTEDKGKVTTTQIQSQLCKISVYDTERKEWITKSDGAENTDIESIKGGLSDAFKRAAVKWNVGRYMYQMQPVWVKAKKRGKSFVIDDKDDESMKKLRTEYNRVVAEIFGKDCPVLKETTPPPTKKQTKQNTQPQQASPQKANNQAPPDSQQQVPVYEVQNVCVNRDGGKPQSKIVLFRNGNTSTVFLNGIDPKIQTGTKLYNVKAQKGNNFYGDYYWLGSYQIAA